VARVKIEVSLPEDWLGPVYRANVSPSELAEFILLRNPPSASLPNFLEHAKPTVVPEATETSGRRLLPPPSPVWDEKLLQGADPLRQRMIRALRHDMEALTQRWTMLMDQRVEAYTDSEPDKKRIEEIEQELQVLRQREHRIERELQVVLRPSQPWTEAEFHAFVSKLVEAGHQAPLQFLHAYAKLGPRPSREELRDACGFREDDHHWVQVLRVAKLRLNQRSRQAGYEEFFLPATTTNDNREHPMDPRVHGWLLAWVKDHPNALPDPKGWAVRRRAWEQADKARSSGQGPRKGAANS
jgi:hypothetical protein